MLKPLKIITTGEGGVGKTTFLNRYISGSFESDFKMTKGIEFFSKEIKGISGYNFNVILWDFAGQDHFRSLLPNFVKGSVGAFILFDMTRISTLERIEEWIKMIKSDEDVPILILGTKSDLTNGNDQEFIRVYLSKIIEKYDCCFDFLLTSSKTGLNVIEAFDTLVKKIFEN
ncbi:MAG: Rab family GTPase [Promethearchaeota archaeon]